MLRKCFDQAGNVPSAVLPARVGFLAITIGFLAAAVFDVRRRVTPRYAGLALLAGWIATVAVNSGLGVGAGWLAVSALAAGVTTVERAQPA